MLTILTAEPLKGVYDLFLNNNVGGLATCEGSESGWAVLQLDEGIEDGIPRVLEAFPEFAKPLQRHVWLCRLRVDEALAEGTVVLQNEAGQAIFFSVKRAFDAE